MATRVIDLSHHNTIPESLKPARDAGIWGMIHKATEGTGFEDGKLAARMSLADSAGMLKGAYHFIRPGNIEKQVEHFVDTIQPFLDDKFLIALDYEDITVSLADCETWIASVEEKCRRDCVLYSGHVLKEKLAGKPNDFLSERRLWLAQYGNDYELPPGWDTYFLWQFTDEGHIAGVNPPTDLNDFQGTIEELVASWSGIYKPTPVPPSQPAILIDITADPEIQLKLVVNGQVIAP